MEGVLKSWAVPKGLPWIKGEKHLAVEVEDHPIDYADFEGIIPKGQYGGGTVMVWGRGTYEVEGSEPVKALRVGRLTLHLDGEKARGEWTLIRIRSNESKPQWLLLKTGEAVKAISKKRDDQSAKTGRTIKQIAAQRDAEWQSNKPGDIQPSASSRLRARISSVAVTHPPSALRRSGTLESPAAPSPALRAERLKDKKAVKKGHRKGRQRVE
jgi:bifunctional non-homologous end joining protein LigD